MKLIFGLDFDKNDSTLRKGKTSEDTFGNVPVGKECSLYSDGGLNKNVLHRRLHCKWGGGGSIQDSRV